MYTETSDHYNVKPSVVFLLLLLLLVLLVLLLLLHLLLLVLVLQRLVPVWM